ncbi:hypothetical protein Y032_0068g241 [Ancylostoma ceylanicum]|uniref:Uncharacterized protein n=1 Tax=Ancylostoma ceylanicum TaxID=53326 RepID=A0A016TYY6_9BILA|nr:hypothetical protein Y032_0068g241 [Ancylostoma ceylanicum]
MKTLYGTVEPRALFYLFPTFQSGTPPTSPQNLTRRRILFAAAPSRLRVSVLFATEKWKEDTADNKFLVPRNYRRPMRNIEQYRIKCLY